MNTLHDAPNRNRTYNLDTFTGPSFSLKNRLGRVIWAIVSSIFFRLSPKPMHSWRAFILRMFGARVGRGAHVYPLVDIWAPWNLVLGEECVVANGVTLYAQDKITVGRRAVVSQGSYICTGTHDYTQPGFPLLTRPIVIGDHAWIATQSFVHPGIIISEGCVVGARSVVTKNMPAWMVCTGHPCVPIRARDNAKFSTAQTFYANQF